jgi:hypothetical protein
MSGHSKSNIMRISHCLPAGTNIYVLVIIAEVRFLNVRTLLAILMTNSTMEIQLSKAPRIFFDQDKWAEYVAHFDTEEIALMHLSSPPGIDFSWWKDPMKPDEAVRVRKEKLFKHKMDLIQAFYKRLENNSIIASGRSFNSPRRYFRYRWSLGPKRAKGLGGILLKKP